MEELKKIVGVDIKKKTKIKSIKFYWRGGKVKAKSLYVDEGNSINDKGGIIFIYLTKKNKKIISSRYPTPIIVIAKTIKIYKPELFPYSSLCSLTFS